MTKFTDCLTARLCVVVADAGWLHPDGVKIVKIAFCNKKGHILPGAGTRFARVTDLMPVAF